MGYHWKIHGENGIWAGPLISDKIIGDDEEILSENNGCRESVETEESSWEHSVMVK